MKSKTLIDKQMKRKTNPEIATSIIKAKKEKNWLEVASILASPRRSKISINLSEIDMETKEGDTVVVPGKVLSKGEISKKIRIAALAFSQEAEKKLKLKKCEVVSIIEEIKINPEARGIRILRQ